jgi:hypothetical protein
MKDSTRFSALFAWILIVLSLALAFLSLLVPLPYWPFPGSLQLTLFFATIVVVLHFGAPYLFYLGMGRFTKLLRAAYAYMFVGVILLGLAHAQAPVLTVTGAWNGFWVRGGIIAIPYFLAVIFIYLGVYHFARLLNINHMFNRLPVAFAFALFIAVGAAFLPPLKVEPTVSFALSLGLMGWCAAFFFMAAILILEIRRNAGRQYTNAMSWFFWAMAATCVAGLHYLGMLLVLPEDHWYEPYGFVPFAIGALLMVRAGYAFNLIGRETHKTDSMNKASYSPIDVVTYLAGLVSNPKEIDVNMDDLRMLTVRIKNRTQLSDEEQRALAVIFVLIKNYLIHQEKLRVYTDEGLTAAIGGRYDPNANAGEYSVFWHSTYPTQDAR